MDITVKTHPDDIATLRREFSHVVFPVVLNADVDRMIERAIELRETRSKALLRAERSKYFDEMTRAMGSELVENIKKIERAIIKRPIQCSGCGATEGSLHADACPTLAERLRMGALIEGPKPVPDDFWETRGTKLAEPELTPAERTWRAHKGFSR